MWEAGLSARLAGAGVRGEGGPEKGLEKLQICDESFRHSKQLQSTFRESRLIKWLSASSVGQYSKRGGGCEARRSRGKPSQEM